MDRQQQEAEMTEQEKTRQEQETRRQAEFEAGQARARETMDILEARIAPLTFSTVQQWRDDDPEHEGTEWWGYFNRQVLSESGESVGHVKYEKSGYSWKSTMKWTLTSARIPRNRTYYGQASRRYTKFESVVAAIKKFCIAVSADEDKAKVLRREISHYNHVLQVARGRSLHVDGIGRGYASPSVNGFIELLASPIKQDQIEGAEYIRILVRKKKVHTRFDKWVHEHFIDPRQSELNTLDLSKESVE